VLQVANRQGVARLHLRLRRERINWQMARLRLLLPSSLGSFVVTGRRERINW
jgi:hypothetical protein